MRGLASAARALCAASQVISRHNAAMASAVPHTSGLTILRSSARSNHSMRFLPDYLHEPVFQPGQFHGHRLRDDAACRQGGVHVPAAVMLDEELALLGLRLR